MMKHLLALSALVGFVLVALPLTASATLPEPVLGTSIVDGNYSEWDLSTDFFAEMHRSGNENKALESKVYLRYDCGGGILYVLVLAEPGVTGYDDLLDPTSTSWVAIDSQNNKAVNDHSGNNGIPPDFAYIDRGFDGNQNHVRGYEASFSLPTGSYKIIVHLQIWDGSGQTSATLGFPKSGPDLVIPDCSAAVEQASFGMIKALYR